MGDGLDLPDGFDDAPADVQTALLSTYPSEDLVGAICSELSIDAPQGDGLRKSHKAAVLLAVRGESTDVDPNPEAESVEPDGGAVADTPTDTDPAPDTPSDDDAHRCEYCARTFDTENGLAIHKGRSCRPDWLTDDPDVVLSNAPTSRSLEEIIEVVVTEDDVLDVHKRLDSTTIGQARGGILGPLGLVGPDGDLPGERTLDERLSVLSGWVDDGGDD